MKKIIVIDDYSKYCLWDDILYDILPTLDSKPRGMTGSTATRLARLPEGDWCLQRGTASMAVSGAYERAGIMPPKYSELPAVFCLDENDCLIDNIIRADPKSTVAFIKKHTL